MKVIQDLKHAYNKAFRSLTSDEWATYSNCIIELPAGQAYRDNKTATGLSKYGYATKASINMLVNGEITSHPEPDYYDTSVFTEREFGYDGNAPVSNVVVPFRPMGTIKLWVGNFVSQAVDSLSMVIYKNNTLRIYNGGNVLLQLGNPGTSEVKITRDLVEDDLSDLLVIRSLTNKVRVGKIRFYYDEEENRMIEVDESEYLFTSYDVTGTIVTNNIASQALLGVGPAQSIVWNGPSVSTTLAGEVANITHQLWKAHRGVENWGAGGSHSYNTDKWYHQKFDYEYIHGDTHLNGESYYAPKPFYKSDVNTAEVVLKVNDDDAMVISYQGKNSYDMIDDILNSARGYSYYVDLISGQSVHTDAVFEYPLI